MTPRRLWVALGAVGRLRIHQGVAGRLPWLLAPAFLVGLAAAWWAPGVDDSQRALAGDRIGLGVVWGLAMLLASVPAALSFPLDVRSGRAIGWLGAPLPRWALVLGGAFGHAGLASVLAVGLAAAATLGLDAGGLGAQAREPLRRYVTAERVGEADLATAEQPVAFAARLPAASRSEPIVLRARPEPRLLGDSLPARAKAVVAVQPEGLDDWTETEVEFVRGAEFVAELPRRGLRTGTRVRIEVRSGDDDWGLSFERRGLEVGGGARPFLPSLFVAVLCAAPLLLLLSAAATCGAVRFGAPTAILLTTSFLLLLAGRDFFLDAVTHVQWTVEQQRLRGPEEVPDSLRVTPLQVGMATAVGGLYELLPAPEHFLVGERLLERRTVEWRQVGESAVRAAPLFVGFVLVGWGLLATREFD